MRTIPIAPLSLAAAIVLGGCFWKSEPAAPAKAADEKPAAPAERPVVINGRALKKDAVDALEKRYGVRPRAGDYWYDPRSGLYGVTGFAAYGFMYAGHDFGEPARDASNGDTGVLVNGRELPKAEWLVWSQMLGTIIQPGAYWLDANGNAGYAGIDMPTVNLFAAARQNAYAGASGAGDSFWSTRFSAGNANAGNTQGYVSVPGHGPVGYGF